MTAKKTPRAAKRDIMDRIHLEGVPAAFQAMLEVCRDPKAPAPARAACGSALFRAAGLFDTKDGGGGLDKNPGDMTADELAEFIRNGEAHIANLQKQSAALDAEAQDGEDGLFG
ncbi:hypothetical protein SAMN04489859_1006160 [Paracoccus alcaliphilus]|uniref:Uncharacterized protein n=1 Tax=Paracoccus alcaliphilus TaxID=34002 RepID=A0A1H8GET2_9RHOB|nr:hypothetical protein [Paracoccus alcaliphilus]WCR17992.1 hypothetical protein JHW40_17130 [Paracoccus alcaliphilus]SEN42651.1 hypothetical protein SAMN04489859_1006160 [Paracoccus alcaliphilus]